MKTGQRGMKFSMKRTCGRGEAASACDCYATAMRLAPSRHYIVARASVARIQYELPFWQRSLAAYMAIDAYRFYYRYLLDRRFIWVHFELVKSGDTLRRQG
ncbi:hypothetical protein Y032_0002g771 [Ancylostoma ceylanicum]|uniref:Uncharacterized protein n=1 Tax=Ancylostoma ceylanicum TaxID=53326 RepID=A0A016W0K6_9BILA|nr:hypothetical protein Y032_0002g771 [Ancylostoma ceylanicum]